MLLECLRELSEEVSRGTGLLSQFFSTVQRTFLSLRLSPKWGNYGSAGSDIGMRRTVCISPLGRRKGGVSRENRPDSGKIRLSLCCKSNLLYHKDLSAVMRFWIGRNPGVFCLQGVPTPKLSARVVSFRSRSCRTASVVAQNSLDPGRCLFSPGFSRLRAKIPACILLAWAV